MNHQEFRELMRNIREVQSGLDKLLSHRELLSIDEIQAFEAMWTTMKEKHEAILNAYISEKDEA